MASDLLPHQYNDPYHDSRQYHYSQPYAQNAYPDEYQGYYQAPAGEVAVSSVIYDGAHSAPHYLQEAQEYTQFVYDNGSQAQGYVVVDNFDDGVGCAHHPAGQHPQYPEPPQQVVDHQGWTAEAPMDQFIGYGQCEEVEEPMYSAPPEHHHFIQPPPPSQSEYQNYSVSPSETLHDFPASELPVVDRFDARGYVYPSDQCTMSSPVPTSTTVASEPVEHHHWAKQRSSGHDPRIFERYQPPEPSMQEMAEHLGIERVHHYAPAAPSPFTTTPLTGISPQKTMRYRVEESQSPLMTPPMIVPSQQPMLEHLERMRRRMNARRRRSASPRIPKKSSPPMDHLPTPFSPVIHIPNPPIVPSQAGTSTIDFATTQFAQAREEQQHNHSLDLQLKGRSNSYPYIHDHMEPTPAPSEPWACAAPSSSRRHPLVFAKDGSHPLIKSEPGEIQMSSLGSPSSSPPSHDHKIENYQDSPPSPGSILKVSASRKVCEKKPVLACLFCRGRKIACGPPLPGSKDKTCNQCARRNLKCEYPTESRRGQRKRGPKTAPCGDHSHEADGPPKAKAARKN
ncbi:hypothetical protein JAAARDRAFT_37116 [Jaapia argillacea MUCL 33604]|uniref:Zn(2)-C6 fungal-type domain-containing protein n=1 Tax=Jaapia argillacea MUCL 33604 TaxID=933084 RepID=A0A067PZC3_9AGAM|nr:hypothetical protein JAAARDRAFT_37116 [Jaapia argillacea MUCL 33604]